VIGKLEENARRPAHLDGNQIVGLVADAAIERVILRLAQAPVGAGDCPLRSWWRALPMRVRRWDGVWPGYPYGIRPNGCIAGCGGCGRVP